MPSKKGKAYTWRCKDWAYRTATRTFAIRFDDDMEALKWKTELEQSKINNRRMCRGLDIPNISAVDDLRVVIMRWRLFRVREGDNNLLEDPRVESDSDGALCEDEVEAFHREG